MTAHTPKVRAKFRVMAINPTPNSDPKDLSAQVILNPVMDDGREDNATWSKYTPGGEISLWITNPAAIEAFELGRAYFIDFTPAD
ncbi:MAG: hypothetical protein AAFQ67_09475 [Pseudomonadota bacterium]